MNRRREVIINLTSSNIPLSFTHWNEILNYFDIHKEQLDIEDLKIIVDRCEECRLYLNQDNTDIIEKKDVVPNVYEYLENKIKDNKETWKQDYPEIPLLNAL